MWNKDEYSQFRKTSPSGREQWLQLCSTNHPDGASVFSFTAEHNTPSAEAMNYPNNCCPKKKKKQTYWMPVTLNDIWTSLTRILWSRRKQCQWASITGPGATVSTGNRVGGWSSGCHWSSSPVSFTPHPPTNLRCCLLGKIEEWESPARRRPREASPTRTPQHCPAHRLSLGCSMRGKASLFYSGQDGWWVFFLTCLSLF